MPYERILLALDGSGLAESALGHAARLARGSAATLHLLHVQASRPAAGQSSVNCVDWRLRRVEMQGYLDEIGGRVASDGVATASAVREGRAAEQIVEYAREQAIDLVVLSAYGDGGPSPFPFGSTVQKVIGSSGLSFMLVRPDGAPHGERAGSHRRVLVPLDGSYGAEWAAREAAAMLGAQLEELLLLQIVPAPDMPRCRPLTREERELREKLVECNRHAAERYLLDFAGQLGDGLAVSTRLVVGDDIAANIVAAADREQVDLIAMSAHGAHSDARWGLGTVCQELVCRNPVPLLVLQQPGTWARRRRAGDDSDGVTSSRLLYADQPPQR